MSKSWGEYWDSDLCNIEQQSRFERARDEKHVVDKKDADKLQAVVINDGTKYLTNTRRCSCVDFQYRQKPCKHMYTLAFEFGLLNPGRTLPNLETLEPVGPYYIGPDSRLYKYYYDYLSTPHLRDLFSGRGIVIDIETTGLSRSSDVSFGHEILQLAIIDDAGEVLLNELYKPELVAEWAEAEAIHGITASDVASSSTIAERLGAIQEILDAADYVAIYNAEFDVAFLEAAGLKLKRRNVICLMREGSQKGNHHGSLGARAAAIGYKLEGAHDAVADCKAALALLNELKAESNKVPKAEPHVYKSPKKLYRGRPLFDWILLGILAVLLFSVGSYVLKLFITLALMGAL